MGHKHDSFAQQLQAALQLHRSGDLHAAKTAYEKIIKANPKYTDALHLLGVLTAQQGDLSTAANWLQQAVELEPTNSTYQNNLANALTGLMRYEQAIQHYQKALQLNPQYAEAYNNLGKVYYKQRQWEQALKQYAKVIELQPDHIIAHQNLGLVFLQQGKLEEARKQFHNVVSLHPASVVGHYQLGNLYLQQEQWQQASEHYQEAIKYQPNHIEALNNLAVVYLRQGDQVQAVKQFAKVLEYDPDYLPARNNLAATLIQLDRFAEAIEHYRKILEQQPGDVEAHYNIGFAYMMTSELTEAIKHFYRAIEQRPNYADAYANLGACYLKLEQRSSAIHNYRKALELQPDNPTVEFMLSALTGHQRATPPKEYVRDLFDNYAVNFDKHLTQQLGYQVPQHIYHAVTQVIDTEQKPFRILDLGCGTGLCAPLFKPLANYLAGVDLSPKMLQSAAEKELYDELQEEDIVAYLQRQQSGCLDIIIAADVLVYLGDLKPLFQAVRQALVSQGIFAFTTEINEAAGYALQQFGRYAHAQSYIEQLALDVGFSVEHYEKITARLQENKPLVSHLFVLKSDKKG